MRLSKKITSIAISGAVLLSMAGAAMAAPAVATGSVNVRSGPSTQYQRVDTLQRNQLVEVTGCRGGWCYVEKRGADGWVSANYLQQVRKQRTTKPSISFSFNFGNVPFVQPHRDRHDNGKGNGRWNDNRGHDRDHWSRDRDDRRNNGVSIQFGN